MAAHPSGHAPSTRRHSLKRWHPYLGEWVIIAPATSGRPWNGAVIDTAVPDTPAFDPGCYLCPGVVRASGEQNPAYEGVYIFTNDFASLSHEPDDMASLSGGDHPARGLCRVVCFSPRHNETLPVMSGPAVTNVLHTLAEEYRRLSALPGIAQVMIFENRGKIIGVSNPHPHGQIYCTDFVPRMQLAMYRNALDHRREHGECLFCRVLAEELADGSRIVTENDHAVAFVPPFARHAFEVHLMPRRHVPAMTDLDSEEMDGFAALFHEMQIRFDNLFAMPFPNITIFQNPPRGDEFDLTPCHFRIEFYPPLRSPDKLKYMAGFESGGGNIVNPALPDESAAALRETSTTHYTRRKP